MRSRCPRLEAHLPTGNEAKESERQVRELEDQLRKLMEQAEVERKAHEKLQAENATLRTEINAKRQEVKQGEQSAKAAPFHHDTWHFRGVTRQYRWPQGGRMVRPRGWSR